MTQDQVKHAQEHMGWPWDRLAAAEAAVTEAREMASLAIEVGTPSEKFDAERALRSALDDRDRVRNDLADVFLQLLDCAVKYAMHEVFGKVMAVAVAADWRAKIEAYMAGQAGSAQHLLWMFGKIADRLDKLESDVGEVEDAVMGLQRKEYPRVAL